MDHRGDTGHLSRRRFSAVAETNGRPNRRGDVLRETVAEKVWRPNRRGDVLRETVAETVGDGPHCRGDAPGAACVAETNNLDLSRRRFCGVAGTPRAQNRRGDGAVGQDRRGDLLAPLVVAETP